MDTIADTKQSFAERVNLIGLLDPSRAGATFFLAIFDQHPEVLTCPWIHYIYSYIITEFGEEDELDSSRAHSFMIDKSFFRFAFNDLDARLAREMSSFGNDPTAVINPKTSRLAFDKLVLDRGTITRRDLILAAYYAFAVGSGRDIEKVKYILVSDAVSLRAENPLGGFSGKAIHAMIRDFPNAKCITLVRDFRACFASARHEWVNRNENMYTLSASNYFNNLDDLCSLQLTRHGCVYLYWLTYFIAAARTTHVLESEYIDQFITVRNEDLNTNWLPTLRSTCDWLDVSFWRGWAKRDYAPTSVGKPWRGHGAYNNRSQANLHGPLQNDPDEVSRKVTGPNIYVTQRWKSRLGNNEIKLLEILYRGEMKQLSYEFLYYAEPNYDGLKFITNLMLPFKGELPTLKWIINGRWLGPKEISQRLFYAMSFLPFYLLSRLQLLRLYVSGFFKPTAPPAKAGHKRQWSSKKQPCHISREPRSAI